MGPARGRAHRLAQGAGEGAREGQEWARRRSHVRWAQGSSGIRAARLREVVAAAAGGSVAAAEGGLATVAFRLYRAARLQCRVADLQWRPDVRSCNSRRKSLGRPVAWMLLLPVTKRSHAGLLVPPANPARGASIFAAPGHDVRGLFLFRSVRLERRGSWR